MEVARNFCRQYTKTLVNPLSQINPFLKDLHIVSEAKNKTLVSLGMSCQTTHQLRRLADSQQNTPQTSSGLIAPSGLFDWLICPPASTIELLNQRIPDFTRNSLQTHKDRAYWSDFNLYFWHGFLVTDRESRRVSINETFEQELTRWRYLRDRFSALDPKQTMFVISNTQNNLVTEVFDESELGQINFTAKILDDLNQSLARYFNTTTSNIHLEVLTRQDRSSELGESGSVHFLPLDQNEWKGSKQSWNHWWQQVV